jgi:hypothetical protein
VTFYAGLLGGALKILIRTHDLLRSRDEPFKTAD